MRHLILREIKNFNKEKGTHENKDNILRDLDEGSKDTSIPKVDPFKTKF